ncbi:MAG: thiol peroxidase [Desulforegulaceae bacterium]|nr:thiol peroxidase [Desulforegulaceae bacterium]
MQERTGLTAIEGNPLTLIGPELKIGEKAPEFNVTGNEMNNVSLSDFKEKVLVISAVPSLDTPVCDIETQRFNSEAGKLNNDIKILTISMDLPFAQKRWCGANNIDKVITLSDHKEASFGMAFGVLIKELRLLARAVFVLDKHRIIQNMVILDEVTKEPDYNQIIQSVKKLI